MGVVWLAERADGLLDRKVALKLPHVGWSGDFVQRFARERAILATLEHPHIARLYDAGTDEFRRPYMALEYVEGEPIDAYCRRRGLELRARVALLLQVAEALAFAHARLVVHRDIKPSNILVNAEGQVRLLDFGIAKLLEGDVAQETELTRLAGRALTPQYASPEQLRGETIGTASDVFSLGVVAFELLAGAKPWPGGSAPAFEPAGTSAEAPSVSSVAADPALRRRLRGDLDAVVARTLKLQPVERYGTMAALAEDFARWLRGAPVRAGPDRLGYRLRKFIARHRVGVALGTTVVLIVLVASGVSLWQMQRAREEAARALAVQDFLIDLFRTNTAEQPDPERARRTTARELLDLGAARLDGALRDQPAARLLLLETLGRLYAELGLWPEASRLTAARLELARAQHDVADPELASALIDHAQALDALERHSARELMPLLHEAERVLDKGKHDASPLRARLHMFTADHLTSVSLSEARRHAARAVALYRQLPDSRPGLDDALETLAMVQLRGGDHAQAVARIDEAVTVARARGRHDAQLARLLRRGGEIRAFMGQFAAAERMLREALALSERANGVDGAGTILVRATLARWLALSGRTAEARRLANQVLADAARSGGPGASSLSLDLRRVIIEILRSQGDFGAAHELVMDGLRELGAEAPDSFLHAALLLERAAVETETRQLERARASLAATSAMLERLGFGPRTNMGQTTAYYEAEWYLAQGDGRGALAKIEAMEAALGDRASGSPLSPLRPRALAAIGRTDEARQLVDGALASIEAAPDRAYQAPMEASLLRLRGELHLRAGDCAGARPALERARELLSELHVTASPHRRDVEQALARCSTRTAAR
jgi:serine/threonine-protein kinase